MAYYIKWSADRKNCDIWNGPVLGRTAMEARGYERAEALPALPADERPLESMTFSKYKAVRKLMEAGLWEGIKSGLTENERDFLYLAQSFSLGDDVFSAIYAKLKPAVPRLDEWLRECELE